MRGRRRSGPAGEAARRRHGWLELLQSSGPFLTLPVVDRVFPNGLPAVPARRRAELRAAVAAMLDSRGHGRHWLVRTLLCDVLGWGTHLLIDTAVPDSLAEIVVEHSAVLRPDFAFHAEDSPEDTRENEEPGDDETEPGDAAVTNPYRLLGCYTPWGSHPLARTTVGGWTASPAERLAVLLRARDVPVGLVTDGRWWALVWAPAGGATGVAVWDAGLFSEEPESLQAFVALLERARFLGVAAPERLPQLLIESQQRQEEVTETLGRQVRDAVELLLGTLDRLDTDSGGRLLSGVDDDELYAGVVTVMMRVVFLLFAEERRLLPSDDELYATGYSVGRLVEELESRAVLAGEQSLEHRTGAWHRLLAVSRAVHGGVAHEDLRLPAYGGGLFDPDTHPWLEGRARGEPPGTPHPPAVDDRTVLRMLRAVQYVDIGGERRRLTFRALGVEQIGYVYEGLLDLEVRTAPEVVLGLVRPPDWPKSKEPAEIPLTEARAWLAEVPPRLAPRLRARTGWSESRVEQALARRLAEHERTGVSRTVGADPDLLAAILPLAPVLRWDERGLPAITLPGRRYVAPSTRRAATGTHYTPRELAEQVVVGALQPLVYRPGPLQTANRDAWALRPSEALLGLRVADIAMGSGAFLVAACRYLADRLVEAWTAEGRADALRATAQREHSQRASTADAEVPPVLRSARRLVAEHCLYGVDINPLAVEMAKLSLWLVTMDRERPFGFLDDRFLCGDSLLGLTSLDQLEELHVDPAAGRRIHHGALDFTAEFRPLLQHAADLRRQITAHPVVTIRDVEHKQRLLAESRELTRRLTVVADAVTGTGMLAASLTGRRPDAPFTALALHLAPGLDGREDGLAAKADHLLNTGRPAGREPRRPLHWPLAFPEVVVDSPAPGFDAIVGNPPFLGGQSISRRLGGDYLAWLQRWDGGGVRGSADLAARFVLRAHRLLSSRGQLGYLATNTLVQGKTLVVGMMQAVEHGLSVRAGRSSHPWPSTSANLEIVDVWASRAPISPTGLRVLDGEPVPAIGPDLEPVGRVAGRPYRLPENEDTAFQGSNVLGLGFTMAPEEAAELIARDPRNAEALQPYVIGKDLNQRPDTSASRWVINFRDWPLDRAEEYPELIDRVRRLVKPERDRNNRAQRRNRWWIYAERAPDLYEAISGLDHVLALSLVSNAVLPVRVPTGQVFGHACAVFALDDFASLAVLSSSVHSSWVIRYTSTMRTDIRYAPSDVFLTLPRPAPTPKLHTLGRRLDTERRELMRSRGWGLTTTYNHVHSPTDRDPAVQALRELHAAIDDAVLAAYGWDDLDPQLGHHPTKIGTRWTVSPAARFELLDRLLGENHRRHADESR